MLTQASDVHNLNFTYIASHGFVWVCRNLTSIEICLLDSLPADEANSVSTVIIFMENLFMCQVAAIFSVSYLCDSTFAKGTLIRTILSPLNYAVVTEIMLAAINIDSFERIDLV